MAIDAIRDDISAVLADVGDIGRVYDYQRWANTWDAFLDLFKAETKGNPVIRGWMIEYRGFPDEVTDPQLGVVPGVREHEFAILGYMGHDDATITDKDAANLAETVCNALDADATLHDGATWVYASPARVAVFELRKFSGVLAHHAEIGIKVTEFVSN